MKAVTVRQPEITRLAAHEIRVDIKTWRTPHRGPILLVSALTPRIEPAGYAIAVARLVDCRPMTKADEKAAGKTFYPHAQAWIFEDVNPIKIFPVRVGLQLFDVPVPSFGIQVVSKVLITPAIPWSKKQPRRRADGGSDSGPHPTLAAAAAAAAAGAGEAEADAGGALDVLVVDADPLVARGIQRAVLGRHRVRVVATSAAALEAIQDRLPDVLVCDYELGTESAGPLLEVVASTYPTVRRILYSSSHPAVWRRYIDRTLVQGSMLKPATREELIAVIAA
jgi:CheY-like chemotaxis protein